MKIPRCMSTQHPDNASIPFFSNNNIIDGETEVKEAFYAYSTLGCDEQMWDCEGKEVDTFVVKKLLSNYGHYFRKKRLGKEVFLTVRVPNPEIEKNEGKVLLETLESIPRNFDAAKVFYGKDIAPIFEVIIPMVTNHRVLERVNAYYEKFVVQKARQRLMKNDIRIGEWIGEFKPESINVIPLVEDKPSLKKVDGIVGNYLKGKRKEYQRVFLARSDPALNYGSLSAVLLVKEALQKLYELEKKTSVDIYPIIGVGTVPFRGNLHPYNIKKFLKSYPSVQTFTIQSAFKYDYPPSDVMKAVEKLKKEKRRTPLFVDIEKSEKIIKKVSGEYKKQLNIMAPLINTVAGFIPARRKRKLHVGLFGYSRKSRDGISLPRAIRFCASLYSVGIPPELIGLNGLKERDLDYIHGVYPGFKEDIEHSLQYLNKKNFERLYPSVYKKIQNVLGWFEYEIDEEHKNLSKHILRKIEGRHAETVVEEITKAALIRKFLG